MFKLAFLCPLSFLLENFAPADISRATLTKTAAAAKQGAGLAKGFFCAIAADLLHGAVPVGDSTAAVHDENAVGHGIYYPAYKAVIQHILISRRHPVSFFTNNVTVTNGNSYQVLPFDGNTIAFRVQILFFHYNSAR